MKILFFFTFELMAFTSLSWAQSVEGHKVYKNIRVVGGADPAYSNGFSCEPKVPGKAYSADELCEIPLVNATLPSRRPIQGNVFYPLAEITPRPNAIPTAAPAASIPPANSFAAKKFTGQQNYAKMRELALKAGVPAEVYDRAARNYTQLYRTNKTSRGCFMAADLTGLQKKTWTFCFNPAPRITEIVSSVSGGSTPGCAASLIRNECPRLWGNRADSCLPAGGNYITGASKSTDDQLLAPLIGLDPGVNSNSVSRNQGIRMSYDHPKIETGQGSMILSDQFKDFPMSDLSARAEGGGMAFYSYPSKEDLLKFMKGQEPPYWNAECRAQIDYAGWVDEADSGRVYQATLERALLRKTMELMGQDPDSLTAP